MAGQRTPHRYPEKHSISKLLELFVSSRDMIYGESHPNRVSEVQDETPKRETRPSSSKQPSASTMFSTSELARQDTQTDLLADSRANLPRLPSVKCSSTSRCISSTRIFESIH